MNLCIILIPICLLFINVHGEECYNNKCNQLCNPLHLNGQCDPSRRQCKCSYGQTCSKMGSTCQFACKLFNMDGKCDDNGECQCSVTPKSCARLGCKESCTNDPSAAGCAYVVATECLEYGPITFCECTCVMSPEYFYYYKLFTIRKNTLFNHTTPTEDTSEKSIFEMYEL